MSDPQKFILDASCGGRQFWFNKQHENALFIDNRELSSGSIAIRPNFEVKPDQIMDNRALTFKDHTFKLVIWDPPHIKRKANTKPSIIRQKYGTLDPETWEADIQKGFSECFRVLQYFGVLILKWNEGDIPLKDVLKLLPETPLFGHKTGRYSRTNWLCFMKIPKENFKNENP